MAILAEVIFSGFEFDSLNSLFVFVIIMVMMMMMMIIIIIYIEKYLQLKCAVSIPKKISTCLIRARKESFGNDDVSNVHPRKYEMVRMR